MDQDRDSWREQVIQLLTQIATGTPMSQSQSFPVFDSQLRLAGVFNSDDFTNDFAETLTITVKTGASIGGAKVLTKIQRKDEVSGEYVDIPGATTSNLAQNLSTDLTISPGIAQTNNRRVNDIAPRIWRVVCTVAGGTSINFEVNGEVL